MSWDQHDPFLRIPLDYNCSHLLPDLSSPPRNLSIHVFRPNTRRYDSPASLCKIVEHTVVYSVNFFGARAESHSESHRSVTVEHCRRMQTHKRCEFGMLSSSDGIYKTPNSLVYDWPSAPFGCCVEHTLSVTNCYLVPTTVHGRHGSSVPESP